MEQGANGRVIRVINFMVAHPTEVFTVSELSQRLGLSIGSAHRVLQALSEAGYLIRHDKHKTYSLGLALIAVGQVALEQHKVVAIAQREIEAIADEFGVVCLASAVTGSEILYVAKRGTLSTHSAVTRVGIRRPFVPPLGLCLVAWSGPSMKESYLQRAPTGLSMEMRNYLDRVFTVIRERGYSIAALDSGISALSKLVSDHVDSYQSDQYWRDLDSAINQLSEQEVQLLAPEDLDEHRISHISAPVFSSTGEAILELTLTGITAEATRPEIEKYADRLLAAATNVTSEIYGRKPPG